MAVTIGTVALLGTTGAAAAVRISATPPPAMVNLTAPDTLLAAPGTPAPVTLPPQGAMALDSDADDRLAARDADTPRPIASVAKTMTALVVIEAHPLEGTADGPVITMTQEDVDLYRNDLAADGSTVPVTAGERLTERQLLLGLMLPSANNFADTLARWVAGGAGAFSVRLNERARSLGMRQTHFEDASGFSPLTVSTATDLLKLGRAALAQPALAAIVSTRTATLPDGTVLRTLDDLLLTEPGWLGIKTGSTPQAGGCLLFAARRPSRGDTAPVTLVGAVLGQTDRSAAQQAAKHAVDSAFAGYVPVDLAGLSLPLEGRVTTPWGSDSTVQPAESPRRLVLLRQGSALRLAVTTATPRAPLSAGTRVGTSTLSVGDRVLIRRPVVVSTAVPGPSILWRLFHS